MKLIAKFEFGPKKEKPLPAVALLLDSARGVYIPRDFASFERWNIKPQDAAILSLGPDSEFYWDVWNDVLCYAFFEQDGNTWELYQDGDLWALCTAQMSDEEKRNFGFDE